MHGLSCRIPQQPLSYNDKVTIETLCDRFEERWNLGRASIDEMLHASAGKERAFRVALLSELILLDMEYRFRRVASANGHVAAEHEGGDSVADQPAASALVEHYLNRFPELAAAQESELDLIAAEFRLRQQWADKPRYDTYLHRFPGHASTLPALLRQQLNELRPPSFKVYENQRVAFATLLDSRLEIGRQRRAEPSPYCRLEGPEADRIIVTSLEKERRISRTHLLVELVAVDELRIVNMSRRSDIVVQSDRRLGAGHSCYVHLPVVVQIPGRVIRIERPEPWQRVP